MANPTAEFCDIRRCIDVLDIKPLANDRRTDVRLVLVVRRNDFDAPAVDREAKLLGRHASRLDRSAAGGAGKRPIHVGYDTDLYGVIGDLCVRWSGHAGRDGNNQVQRLWKPRNGHDKFLSRVLSGFFRRHLVRVASIRWINRK